MGYIIAFLVFILIISIIGFLFSILWPILLALIVIGAISSIIGYRKRKKFYEDFLQGSQNNTSFYQDDASTTNVGSDDIIDVEFSEEEVDEK